MQSQFLSTTTNVRKENIFSQIQVTIIFLRVISTSKALFAHLCKCNRLQEVRSHQSNRKQRPLPY